MNKDFENLKEHLLEINNINSVAALLYWDQATYMPEGGAAARGRQLATLRKLSHERLISPELGHLLNKLQSQTQNLPYDSVEASLVRVASKEFERAIKVPTEFMSRFSNHTSATYDAWVKSKEQSTSKPSRHFSEKTLDLSREYSSFFAGAEHVADPLIDISDEGVKTKAVQALFENLRAELVPMVKAISECERPDESLVRNHYEIPKQIAFGEDVVRAFGYDFTRGRQDKTHHPFMIKFSLGDVRITTRFKEDDVTDALFSTMHEAGHAMYEQGINLDFEGTPMAGGTSAGVHESQSRLWENLVGRSRAFWSHFYPKLLQTFPDLQKVALEDFYKIINKVEPSLIRTDADEVTYNLHVMIRFDLELALLEGRLAVKDLPDAWNARYEKDLGVTPPNNRHGVMQDVHWHADFIGGQFQCYTLGNILSAQFFESANKAHPEIASEIAQGQFSTLHAWLKNNLYRYGKQFTADEVVQKATGQALTTVPYVAYLKKKYGEIYGLKF